MQNDQLDQNNQPVKASRTPFLKFYTGDWIAGTSGLTLEQRAFYFECLIRMWERKGGLPNDHIWLSRAVQCDARVARRVLAVLIRENKLIVQDDFLINPRLMAEIETNKKRSRSALARPQLSLSKGLAKPQLSQNVPENETISKEGLSKQNTPIFQKPEYRIQKEEEIAAAAPVPDSAALPSPKLDLKNLEARLLEACNGSLDNPVNCMGLLNLATPQMWLANGCDLELDVLPALTAAGKKYSGKRIRDWGYFTGIVAEARAKRCAGLPDVTVAAPVSKFEASSSRMSRIMAKLAVDAGATL